jgi:hypothetical protein
MGNSAAESVASSNHALAAFLASAPAPDGRAHAGYGTASDPVVAIDTRTMVWKPILDWVVAHR